MATQDKQPFNATHHERGMQNMSDNHTSTIATSGNVATGSAATDTFETGDARDGLAVELVDRRTDMQTLTAQRTDDGTLRATQLRREPRRCQPWCVRSLLDRLWRGASPGPCPSAAPQRGAVLQGLSFARTGAGAAFRALLRHPAALVLLALAVAVPESAQAQSTLVSNLDQNGGARRQNDPGAGEVSAHFINGNTRVGQRFRTGTGNITLTSVDIGHYGRSVASEHRHLRRFNVRVCGVSFRTVKGVKYYHPSTTCTNLTAPSGDFGWNTATDPDTWIGYTRFSDPSNATLVASRDYFVEIYGFTGKNSLATTISNGEDSATLADWSIYDGLHNQLWGSWTTERSIPQNAKNFRVRVLGTRSASQVAAPTIEGSPALSEAGSDGTWTPGEAVQVTLTFSEAVNVVTTDGTPSIGIQLGGTTDRRASFASGSGTTELVFSYTLTEADGSHSSMFVAANGLTLNGGTITSNVSGAAAALEHTGAARAALPTAPNQEADRPTARFADLPQSHDGTTAFTVELHFSENIAGLSYKTVAGGLLVVTGATVTGARRLNPPSNQSWEVTVKPTQDSDIAISLPARACTETNAVCVDSEPLAAAAAAAVPGTPFTGTFGVSPAEHDKDTPFKVHFHLSVEPADISYKTVRDSLFTVTGGRVTGARRLDAPHNQSWEVTVDPAGAGDVTLTVRATTACNVAPGVCTEGGGMLPGGERLTVEGPGSLSVADAKAEEGTDDALEFVVTLSRPRFAVTTVQYATSDGQAVKGADYTETTGILRFGVRETQKTIRVPLLDDDIDDSGETMTLTLSSPTPSAYVRIADGEATGTITNSDPLPRALMARFGRTAAVHVVEHVEERLAAPREPGFRGRFAGRELRRGMERDFALSFLSQFGGSAGANAAGIGVQDPMSGVPLGGGGALPGTPGLGGGVGMATATGPMGAAVGSGEGPMNSGGLFQMGLGGGDVLTGSAFSLTRATRQGGILSFWSRGARSSFAGQEGALALGGDVRTTMVGADYAKGPLVAGLSLSHSRGLGEYAGVAGGQVASSVTGLYPWLGYKATDRITVWGVAGYGAGGLSLTPVGGPALTSGLSMAMAAAGTRGELFAGGASGFELAFKADALWVGTSSDGVDSAAGRLAATEAAVTRFRTGLEGARAYTIASRLSLRPSVEVGLRHDGGDAETGAGMDVGGGLVVSDASTGLAVDLRVRMLVMHQAEGFRERGMAVSLSYNPTPSTPLGLTARVAPSWGGQAQSGAEALWGRETMAGMAHGSLASGNRLDADVGYGLPVGSRFVGTPRVGVGTSEYGRDYRLGYSLGALGGEGTKFELGVDALARATMRW